MKLINLAIVLLCLFSVQLTTFAQETPAGKKFADAFWKAIADERSYAAKSALDAIKSREPNFDASKVDFDHQEMRCENVTK